MKPGTDERRKPSVLFLFPAPAAGLAEEVEDGVAPSERLYCIPQLRARGWDVTVSDARHEGLAGKVFPWLFGVIRLVDFRTIRDMWQADIVVVKDEFSIVLTCVARLLGRRIVYFDSMFVFPRRFWRRWSAWWNVRLAHAVVSYSRSQAREWSETLGVDASRIVAIRYGMDTDFYRPVRRAPGGYLLAIGRDMGRDFATLIEALEGTDLTLKLVTLPYLLPDGWDRNPAVEVLGRLSYAELFELYSGAVAAVVPLKAGMTYPTGIRAVYEAGLLGVPPIVTDTPVLREDFTHGEDIWFVPPADPAALRAAIESFRNSPELGIRIAEAARVKVLRDLAIEDSAAELEAILLDL